MTTLCNILAYTQDEQLSIVQRANYYRKSKWK